MNLQLVPKYKKYNKTLHKLFFVTVPTSLRERPEADAHGLPVPIRIDPYKQKKHKQVRITKVSIHEDPRRESKLKRLILIRKKDSYQDSEKGCMRCFGKWFAKKQALNDVESERKKNEKQAEQWRKWKFEEAERVRKAQKEKARLEREAEYVRQVQEIEQQKREMAKNTLKTRYPYESKKRSIPRYSFSNKLRSDPYYPKAPTDEFEDIDKLTEHKKTGKKAKKPKSTDYVPFKETSPRGSKLKSYVKKIKQKDNKKKEKSPDPYEKLYTKTYKTEKTKKEKTKKTKEKMVPYKDPYEKLYDKPDKKKKYKEETILYKDPYETIYDKPDKKKNIKEETLPYKDPYETIYEKPDKYNKNKEDTMSYKDTYETYYDKPLETKKVCPDTCKKYDKPTTSKRVDDDTDQLYSEYYALYGTSTKKDKKRFKDKTVKTQKFKPVKEKKKHKHSRRFVNCFYRICCECYCWFSLFLIIGFAVIMVV